MSSSSSSPAFAFAFASSSYQVSTRFMEWCCFSQVNGYWTWQTVHAAGGAVHTKLPYDCHAGLTNWQSGWSVPKKASASCTVCDPAVAPG